MSGNESESANDGKEEPAAKGAPRSRWRRLALIGVMVPVVASFLMLAPPLLDALTSTHTARHLRVSVLSWAFVAYSVAFVLAPIGLGVSVVLGLRGRKQGNRRLAARAGKAFLLAFSLLVGIAMSELICAWKLHAHARLVHLPITSEQESSKPQPEPTPKVKPDVRPLQKVLKAASDDASAKTLNVVIIGESSAAGVPFRNWISLDRMIVWQLERALPGKTFRAENLAVPGLTLEQAIERLDQLKFRPDLLIVYSGHNEFQTRFGWARKVPYYRGEPRVSPSVFNQYARAISNTAELLGRTFDRFAAELAPPPRKPRELADAPCCTPAEAASLLNDYRRRLDGLLDDCNVAGIPTIVVLSPSNEGGFDPNRSILPPDTTPNQQLDFLKRLKDLRRLETSDPSRATDGYRGLIAEQPGFAESHYRLGRLLEAAGSYPEAREEYLRARDLDGLPFRCQTPYLEVCRELGKRHGSIILDAPRLLAKASPHGIVDDRLMSDAHHPGLNAFVIMARDALSQLKDRKVFGWPDGIPAPSFTLAGCIAHFGLNQQTWIDASKYSWWFYRESALLPRDPSLRDAVTKQYRHAIELLMAGKSPDETGVPSLRIREDLDVKDLMNESFRVVYPASALTARAENADLLIGISGHSEMRQSGDWRSREQSIRQRSYRMHH